MGLCKKGASTCGAGKWSACAGQVIPATEACDNKDNDCDGSTDESLSQACYTGKVGTAGVGLCKKGVSACAAGKWSTCSGEVIPAAEKCDSKDNDCDGSTDEEGATGCKTFYYDGDGDGYALTGAAKKCLCAGSGKYTATKTGDCDDTNKAANPGSTAWVKYITVWAWIDGSDFLHVQGNKVWWVHRNHSKVGQHGSCSSGCATKINGKDWWPKWSGNTTAAYTGLNPPQPSGPIQISLTKVSGRHQIAITQSPTSSNKNHTVVLFNDDPPGGSAAYQMYLSYRCK